MTSSRALAADDRRAWSLPAGVRFELRLLWRGIILPVCLVACALFAVLNVANQAGAVHTDYAQVLNTKAEYRANGMDFAADLRKPAVVVVHGNEQTVTNLARYDYDGMADSIIALSPDSSVSESLKYFGFIFFPVLFFLLGLWMSTVQRRYHFEKVTLARTGTARTVLARQLALLVAAPVVIITVIVVDVVARSIATAVVSSQLPFGKYPPLALPPAQNALAQWGVVLLVVVFFGAGGILVGAMAGVFAIPAIVFLAWDLVVPFLGANDPRNWFVVLGRAVFDYGSGFQLAAPIPLAQPAALLAAGIGAAVLLALGYGGIRIRNPLAT
ncbi:MAG TPA: hypothetical protein VHX87_09840 [Galbitalea sp.]|jgi:hypothetical protein|nr:hypothetical protein [Galbitalea sp.]